MVMIRAGRTECFLPARLPERFYFSQSSAEHSPRPECIPLFGKWPPRVAGVKNNGELS